MGTGLTMRGFSLERFIGTGEDERTLYANGVSSVRTRTVFMRTHLRRSARSSTAPTLTLEKSSGSWQMRTGGGCHSHTIGCGGLVTRSIATEERSVRHEPHLSRESRRC